MKKIKQPNDVKRLNMVMRAYANAKDDRTALMMADRLCRAWFGCDCATLMSGDLPEVYALVANLPCTVRLLPQNPTDSALAQFSKRESLQKEERTV